MPKVVGRRSGVRWATGPRNKEEERVEKRMPPLRAVLVWIAGLTLALVLVLYVSIRVQGPAKRPPVVLAWRAALKDAKPVVGGVEIAPPRRAATLLPVATATATAAAAAATGASAPPRPVLRSNTAAATATTFHSAQQLHYPPLS